jgi:arylsulfatase A-like enzyme
MDTQVGRILDQPEKDVLAENTIGFYYADHGGVLCRSKQFLYDTGTRVTIIIHFPKTYQHLAPGKPGTRTDRIVSIVDLAPSVLSLAGVTIHGYMEGEAFLGSQQKVPRTYAYLFRGRMDERYDMMRDIRDKKYKYIRNYMPHRIYGQHMDYLWKAAATRSWEEKYLAGRCNTVQSIFWETKPPGEFYDITSDPWEINNLSADLKYKDILERMRRETVRWVRDSKDTGFLPEGEMIDRGEEMASYEFIRRKKRHRN